MVQDNEPPSNPGRFTSRTASSGACGKPNPDAENKPSTSPLDKGASDTPYLAATVRLRYCPRTRAYVQRRTAGGKAMPEIIRCLKRYLAREVFNAIRVDYAAIMT